MEQVTQIARQRIHQRSEGQPEQKSLSWAIEDHNEARHITAWVERCTQSLDFSDGVTDAG